MVVRIRNHRDTAIFATIISHPTRNCSQHTRNKLSPLAILTFEELQRDAVRKITDKLINGHAAPALSPGCAAG